MSDSHFDEIATVYDESLPSHVVEHYLRKRVAYVASVSRRGSVLDVGCGTGVLAERLALRGYEVTGADPSEGMLEVLRARRPMVRAVQASGTGLPFEDGTFDLVLCVAVMHHVADPEDVRGTLAEMVRVSKPWGRVLVWDHNPRNPYWGSLMARVPQDTGEERLVGQDEIIRGLIEGGGQVLRCQQLGLVPDFTPRRALGLAAALEWLAERTPGVRRYAAHNVILATKRPRPQLPRTESSATISPSGSR
jgi:SAM-dependent methyltransferase